jgi:hypothetical protein
MAKLFLLSPASLTGLRAGQLTSPRATFAAAVQYRSEGGVPIGDAFAFMSALYFRGKLAYARRFVSPDGAGGGTGIYVITPGFGLVAPDWCLTADRMKRMRRIAVDARSRAFARPLREHASILSEALPDAAQVILLGSVATGKYVDVLRPVFGERLRFPALFAGLGEMARGGLMLRAAREGKELEYVTLDAPRRRSPGASGRMPAL